MKHLLVMAFLLTGSLVQGQSVFGYWYGFASVKTKSAANNYLVELVLQPEKNHVSGVLNYFFKNTYRSLRVRGNYNAATRQLSLYNVPVIYYGSYLNFEVDCIMNLQAQLRVAKAGSTLTGAFIGLPDYRYTCPDVQFTLHLNADISKKDSVLKAISEYKENFQVWKPTASDTLVAARIIQRKVINYVIEREYVERKNVVDGELLVDSDSLRVDFYDNGEIDGDSISVFFNNTLIAFHQKLSNRAIHFDFVLDNTREVNEIAMFAENLGSIPPNTALMIIDDGKQRHEVRMTSNLDNNAAIRIRRRKP